MTVVETGAAKAQLSKRVSEAPGGYDVVIARRQTCRAIDPAGSMHDKI